MDLPAHLAERTRLVGSSRDLSRRSFVLFWMRTAARGHENPALDVALTLARAHGLPVFVHHGLTERYPFASDRHHRFVLEGARDVAQELAERGIGHAFHLQREQRAGHRGPVLRRLAEAASLVVTDDFPSAPLAGWTTRLAAKVDTPVLAVDTACIVPTKLVGRAFDRAFAFRKATARLLAERVARPWPELETPSPPFVPDLPYEPFPVGRATDDELAAAIATCDIDHGVGPVPHTPGGAVAGYARWAVFRDGGGLARYARDRNDPLRDGVSRLSAYLHHGHVSPLRIAREADRIQREGPSGVRDGAEKFLDELTIWREVAYAFAAHTPDHDSLAALPGWARATLADHARDPRHATFSWETLARGDTGDALWDAAQAQLRVHGELHNNVRMTWGKALLGWTRSPEEALERLVDLNHRYALDGRDPASYGGLLWCLGLFDRPFPPEQPVSGTLRSRPTTEHARRLDVPAYAARTRAPAHRAPPRVAVIGAGVAGLACARTLHDHSIPVTDVDKGRAPGGRTSTRVASSPEGPLSFDHGAQIVRARREGFARFLASWEDDGVVQRVPPDVAAALGDDPSAPPRWVGAPCMGAVCRHLARDLDVRCSVQITTIAREAERWRLTDAAGAELEADALVVAVPAPQAQVLLATAHPTFAGALAAVETTACWALLLATARVASPAAALGPTPALAWVSREDLRAPSSSPSHFARWVVHASLDFTRAHLERSADEVRDLLVRELAAWLGAIASGAAPALETPLHAAAHRWRYAFTARPLGTPCLFDPALQLAVAGDFALGDRVEDAWDSGVAAAGRLLAAEGARRR